MKHVRQFLRGLVVLVCGLGAVYAIILAIHWGLIGPLARRCGIAEGLMWGYAVLACTVSYLCYLLGDIDLL